MGCLLPSRQNLNIYICIILHNCVTVEVVVVPRKASTSPPGTGACGRFRALAALSRGALGFFGAAAQEPLPQPPSSRIPGASSSAPAPAPARPPRRESS